MRAEYPALIPLRDDQPTRTFPIVTVLLIAANVLVYLAQIASGGALNQSLSLVPYEVTHNIDLAGRVLRDAQGQPIAAYGPAPHPLWLTIFTSMFMHGGFLHIAGNMLYLWIFGNNIEDALGKVRFLVFYLVCGAIASAAQIFTDVNSLIPNLGASGAIAGVLGAYFVLYPNARVLTIVPLGFAFLLNLRAYWVLLFWIALQLWQGANGLGMHQQGGTAFFAHIGGFFAGMVIIQLLGGKRLAMEQQRQARYPGAGRY